MIDSPASPAPTRSSERRGLIYVLISTAIAGAIGYVIQALVPGFVSTTEYVAFSVFWSIVYLVVSGLSGFQQEVARATHVRVGDESRGWRVLAGFGLFAGGLIVLVLGGSSALWAPALFGAQSGVLVMALLVAAIGYTFVALLSGTLYGVRFWPGVAAMTVTDSAIRLVFIGVTLAAGAGVGVLGGAVALPFTIAVLGIWLFAGRRVRRDVTLDVGVTRLARNSVSTVLAATATVGLAHDQRPAISARRDPPGRRSESPRLIDPCHHAHSRTDRDPAPRASELSGRHLPRPSRVSA